MGIAALIAAFTLWLTFGTRALRARENWPAVAAMVIGLAALAKGHPLVGGLLIAGGGAWIRRPRRGPKPPVFAQDMAIAEAAALLGVPASADRAAIVAAHRRLIARNHPDHGGTEALAARLNAARDLLLRAKPPEN